MRALEPIDLMVENGLLLSMDPTMGILEEGAIGIRGGSILEIGPTHDLRRRYQPGRVLDASGCAVMPGLINGHTHAPMTIFRGLADDLPLMEWLEKYIFPVEAHLRAEWVRCGALLACAEMLLSGTTTFCDMYLFEEEVARASKEAGMRALVGEVLYDFPSPNYGPIEEGFRYTEELIQRWQGDPLVRIAVEPHAPFTCSPQLLREARKLADSYQVPLITHLSETRHELQLVQETYGLSPVRHLQSLGILDGPTIADHVVWVDEQEIQILKEHGVGVVHNPESNMKLASGVAPVEKMLKAGLAVGLGTDGAASNNDLDLFREMDSAAKLHKVFSGNPAAMEASTVLSMATCLGAKALGMDKLVGSLEPGKRADLILVDLGGAHLSPKHNLVSHLVYAARGSDVKAVVVEGRILVQGGKLLNLDLKDILEALGEISNEINKLVERKR